MKKTALIIMASLVGCSHKNKTDTTIEEAVRVRDRLEWQEEKKYGLPSGWTERQLLDERTKNILQRIKNAPSIAAITAIRLSCISNTGDLVLYLQTTSGTYELNCRGHEAERKLAVADIDSRGETDLDFEAQQKRIDEDNKRKGILSFGSGASWVSYPQDANDHSPPRWQPRYSLRIELNKEEYK